MNFFEIVGFITVALVILLAIGSLYWLFVHPFFQAISIVRWVTACSLSVENRPLSLREKWGWFKWGYDIGGARTTRYSNRAGEWYGIGRWEVYKPEEDEAP